MFSLRRLQPIDVSNRHRSPPTRPRPFYRIKTYTRVRTYFGCITPAGATSAPTLHLLRPSAHTRDCDVNAHSSGSLFFYIVFQLKTRETRTRVYVSRRERANVYLHIRAVFDRECYLRPARARAFLRRRRAITIHYIRWVQWLGHIKRE